MNMNMEMSTNMEKKTNNEQYNNEQNNNEQDNKEKVSIYGLVMSCVMAYKNHVFVVFVSSQEVQIKEQLQDSDGNVYEDLIYNKKASDNEAFDANRIINLIPEHIVWYVNNTYGI